MWKKAVAEKPDEPNARVEPVIRGFERDKALIGPSITFTGNLAGEEDVVIQGKIEGTIDFTGYSVTIGKRGQVKANIKAREIVVEGELDGDLFGQEVVELRATAKVHGNLEAPRVIMQDGALFKGSIDMSSRPAVKDSIQHTEALSKLPPAAKEIQTESGTGERTAVNLGKKI